MEAVAITTGTLMQNRTPFAAEIPFRRLIRVVGDYFGTFVMVGTGTILRLAFLYQPCEESQARAA